MTLNPTPAANAPATDPANAGGQTTPIETTTPASATPAAAANATEAANARLLEESKAWKARALASENAAKAKEQADLQRQGEYKALYEQEKAARETEQNARIGMLRNSAIREAAKTAGCVSIDAVLKLGDLDSVTVEGDSVSGADALVEHVKRQYPTLFANTKAPKINPMQPNAPEPRLTEVTPDNFSKQSKDVKQKEWSKLMDALHNS